MAEPFIGRQTIYGVDGEHPSPYLTRMWIGRLRLHIFYRGDADPDCHDHPWDFWTFPLNSYVEEVAAYGLPSEDFYELHRQIVPAFWLSFRPATHTHRVLGRYDPWGGHPALRPGHDAFYPGDGTISAGPAYRAGKIVTIVWRSHTKRKWGFLKNRDGQWCWIGWRTYVFAGGKNAPCAPTERRSEP